ncbi:hypothetical protein ACM43_30105 [Bradyrhizobium sp. CCBAU 45321]|nr:hypothetical protein [Bradyrhizobium sp. CCBAU 45321]
MVAAEADERRQFVEADRLVEMRQHVIGHTLKLPACEPAASIGGALRQLYYAVQTQQLDAEQVDRAIDQQLCRRIGNDGGVAEDRENLRGHGVFAADACYQLYIASSADERSAMLQSFVGEVDMGHVQRSVNFPISIMPLGNHCDGIGPQRSGEPPSLNSPRTVLRLTIIGADKVSGHARGIAVTRAANKTMSELSAAV